MKSTNQRNNEINISTSTSTSTDLERNPSHDAPDHCRDCNLDADRNLKSDPASLGGIAFRTTWWFIYAGISCFLVLFVGRVFFWFLDLGFWFVQFLFWVLFLGLGNLRNEWENPNTLDAWKKKWWRKKKESKNSSLCSAWILNSPQLCQHIELESLKLELRQ